MLQEYALDPELLSSFKDLRFFLSLFSPEQARLIAKLPSKWKKAVYDAVGQAKVGDVEKKRIAECLSTAFDERILVPRPGHIWNKQESWLANVLTEHHRQPMKAIIAHDNQGNHESVFLGEDLTSDHSSMQVPTALEVERKAAEIVRPFRQVLTYAKEIVFVDPYFANSVLSGRSWQHVNVLQEFLRFIPDAPRTPTPTRVEYHTEVNEKREASTLQAYCVSKRSGLLRSSPPLVIVTWPCGTLHDRFILTDLCAFQCGHGLDESNDDRKLLITLLSDREQHKALLAKYLRENGSGSFEVR